MKLTATERRLLALHYFFPVPKNRLNLLYEMDPNLVDFQAYPAEKLAAILKTTAKKAERLKANLLGSSLTPYEQLYERYAITPIPFTNPLYPTHLLTLIDPPAVLYTQGDISLLAKKRKMAIIGSRKASFYSKQALSYIVPPLVQNDIVVVSGLAQGADTLAHKAAMSYGGKTIAVLGHGLFHLYPKENEAIKNEISKKHLLISEYPPYVRPERWTFPMRNRIISGLSEAIIVTEAARKSGTMSTVEHALDHGKDIYAVPGPVTSFLSEGPNRLIDEGAQPLWSGFQVIDSLI